MKPAAALLRHKLRTVAALPEGAPVPSPCINVCRIDPASGLCEGCLRSLDEIAAWGSLDEPGRRQVWQRVAGRAQPPAHPPSAAGHGHPPGPAHEAPTP